MVSSNMIMNCLISGSNVTNAGAIFGPDLASVQGETGRQSPVPVVTKYVVVPCALVETNRIITLVADVFFVDGMPFLLMVAQRLQVCYGRACPSTNGHELSKHIKWVLDVYKRAGFIVRTILMDGEFEKNQTITSFFRMLHHSS